jgi:2,4-dienoyl-CoA reductase-like NADH-dependent reductase (Old Yellow Enzyme family)
MVFEQFTLPNGQTLKNRIVKAAMEENMAAANRTPSPEMLSLYRRWSKGGTGLLITGNVMVDGRHMTGAGGLVLEDERNLAEFKEWAKQSKSGGSKVWMQISHPGRQAPSNLSDQSLAPSAINLDMGKYSNMFAPAKAMTEAEIQDVIQRFTKTALLAEKTGFDGVEIHAAHGYLISQFLSPLVNKRNDQWGGNIENRARLLVEVVDAIRGSVSANFSVSVKLNSADFQRGGFEPEDAKQVVKMLEGRGVDLIELSGGSYEAPAMQGNSRDEKTLAREAYFLEFAKEIATQTHTPIMTTGGIARLAVAEQVLTQGVDLVGIATGLALIPDLPLRWQQNEQPSAVLKPITWKNKTLAVMAKMSLARDMIRRHATTEKTLPQHPYWFALIKDQWIAKNNVKQYKKWRSN